MVGVQDLMFRLSRLYDFWVGLIKFNFCGGAGEGLECLSAMTSFLVALLLHRGTAYTCCCATSEHWHEACAPLSPVSSSSCLSAGLRRNVTQRLLPLLYVKWESLATGLPHALVGKHRHSLALIEALFLYALPRIAQGYFVWSNDIVWKSTHLSFLTPRSLSASPSLSSVNYSCCWCAAYINLSAHLGSGLIIKIFLNISAWHHSLAVEWSIGFWNFDNFNSFNTFYE